MKNNWFEKIEDYLNGTMSLDERLRFVIEIVQNDELASTVNIYKEIEAEMRNKQQYREQEALLKQTLESLNSRYFNSDHQQDSVPGAMQTPVVLNPAGKTPLI